MHELAKLKAHAKLNLFLQITGKSGTYHRLHSLAAKLDLHDDILVTVEPFSCTIINCSVSYDRTLAVFCSQITDNIVYKAIQAFLHRCGIQNLRIQVHLHKRIPIAAGLGGGSSDAVAIINHLIQLLSIRLTTEHKYDLLRELGSDLFFFDSNSNLAFVSGIGDSILPVMQSLDSAVLLVNPGIEVLTKNIYQACKICNPLIVNYPDLWGYLENAENDLYPEVVGQHPIVQTCVELLMEQKCRIARMTGSGATCFALFDSDSELQNAMEQIKTLHPTWYVCATKFLV